MEFNRDKLQNELADVVYKERNGILFIAPRFGKTRVGIKLLQKYNQPKTLILYPDNKIKKSWEDEQDKMGYSNPSLVYSSFRSLYKYVDEDWDVVIVDECHLLSEANIESLQSFIKPQILMIGLTGTLSKDTELNLKIRLKMPVLASYTREQSIKDGVVSDYQINIVSVPLDNQQFIQYKKKRRTERGQFDAYSAVIRSLQAGGKNTKFLALARMRIIQNSVAKMKATRKLLKEFKEERILVFCGLIRIAEQLGIPVQHSKSDGEELKSFSDGGGNHLAVVKMGNNGITYKPLNRVIINYFDSNPENLQQKIARAMNLEFEGQVAQIYIVTSTEPVERNWLEKALEGLDSKKIKYL